jgi:hypothetical protein
MLSSDGQETSDEPQPKRCRINALEQKHAGFSEGTETTALQSAGTCDTEQTLDEIVPVEHSRCHEESDNIESSDGESNPPIQLCKHCSQGTQVAQLYETIERLQGENEMLQALNMPEYVPPLPPRIQVFHRVRCECDQEERFGQVRITTYLDPPHRMTSDRRWHLQGHLNAPEESVYLDQNKDIVLLVYKNYRCKADAARYQWQGKIQKNPAITATEATPPTSSQESMMINSEVLREALIWASSESQTPGRIQEIRLRDEIKAPYHYLYHDRTYLAQKIRRMDEEHQIHVGLLVTYVEASFEASLKEASALFSQGLVNNETIPYLFEPKMYVVAQDAGELLAYEAECWLKEYRDKEEPEDCWSLRCWSFKFDGSLIKSSRNFRFGWPGSRREVIPIQNLAVYPLRYGSPNLEQELYARGEKFWSCTNRIYVSYDDENIFGDPVQASYCSEYALNVS